MSFISYAQNFEDVMLWRALKKIDCGFYIDIGAQDPVIDSVSLAFYEHGWRGVHIEPTQQYSNKLRNARPDEYIEQVAIGCSQDKLTFYEFTDTGLSTAVPEIAQRHRDAGFAFFQSVVTVVPLDFILDKYGSQAIHWLKIDVEGLEKNVLQSWVYSAVRPWILIIESTKPLTQDENYSEWENLVFDKGYIFAYFDGLNRFYVHQAHREMLHSFAVPPNIFDGFLLSGSATHPFYQLVAKERQQAELKAQQAELKAQQAELKAQQAESASNHNLKQLYAVYASFSWRLTAPIRFGGGLFIHPVVTLRRGKNHVIHRVIEGCQHPLSRLMAVVLQRPQLTRRINQWLLRYPALHQQLLEVAQRGGVIPGAPAYSPPVAQAKGQAEPELASLTPRAHRIYADLNVAIKKNKGNI